MNILNYEMIKYIIEILIIVAVLVGTHVVYFKYFKKDDHSIKEYIKALNAGLSLAKEFVQIIKELL